MKHILLAHDQVEGSAARRHFLECAGFRVSTAASSQVCLSALATELPDLAVIDVLVEGVNGFELCRQIRAKYGVADVPLVLGSELYSADVFRQEASRVGAQAYLVDPRDYDALLVAIHHALVAREANEAQVAA